MTVTEELAKYICNRGYSLKAIMNATGLQRGIVYSSLGKTTRRPLRADEFLSVCAFLQVDPMDFYNKSEQY